MGLFGGRRALEVVKEYSKNGSPIKGKVALVTGANNGAGFETAHALAVAGARVILAGRRLDAIKEAVQSIQNKLGQNENEGSVEMISEVSLDLEDLGDVRSYAQAFQKLGCPLHLLVLNAGVMAQPFRLSPQGHESTWAINHLGHFLLCQLLMDKLRSSQPARVICVSSELHRRAPTPGDDFSNWSHPDKYNWMDAYGASKLSNILMAKELSRRFQEQKLDITAVSLHPGVGPTGLAKEGLSGVLIGLYRAIGGLILFSHEQLAATSTFCCIAPSTSLVQGEYYARCAIMKTSHPLAEDADKAQQLWRKSEELTKDFSEPLK
eukprot:758470-Hanusia_phi.AAC.1